MPAFDGSGLLLFATKNYLLLLARLWITHHYWLNILPEITLCKLHLVCRYLPYLNKYSLPMVNGLVLVQYIPFPFYLSTQISHHPWFCYVSATDWFLSYIHTYHQLIGQQPRIEPPTFQLLDEVLPPELQPSRDTLSAVLLPTTSLSSWLQQLKILHPYKQIDFLDFLALSMHQDIYVSALTGNSSSF